MSGHIVPVRVYIGVFLTLLVLTGVTTWAAFLDLGALNTVVALTIATVKMLLVILFFMHVRYSGGLTRVVILAGFLGLVLLIALILTDVSTRRWTPIPEGWGPSTTAPQSPR